MGIVVKISAPEFKIYADALNSGFTSQAQKQLNLALSRGAAAVARHEAEEIPRDTGAAAKDIDTILTDFSATIRPTKQYMVYVHEGTNPHFPPIAAISGWAERHGINPYTLAKSIARKGTKANPFIPRTWDKSQDEIVQEFSNCASAIAKWTAET